MVRDCGAPAPERVMSLALGILGAGWAAAIHARAAQILGLPVAAIATRDRAKAEAFAATWNIEHALTSAEHLCALSAVDLVVIATPNALHAPQALHALAAGKHVLVEKPMALARHEADAMIAAARAAEKILAVGHMWRYRDEVVAMRARIEAGEFGPIIRTHGHGVHARWGPEGWFADPTLAGGGALIDMGIHAIDTARFLLGDPSPMRVQASIGRGAYADVPVDDDGLVLIDWACGTRSLIEFGWRAPRLCGLEAETEILGREGAARIWPDMPPEPPGYQHCSPPMYAAQLADVVQCCRTGETPKVSAEHGRVALDLVLRAYEAAEGGEP
jgi:predicted dehydrogenase